MNRAVVTATLCLAALGPSACSKPADPAASAPATSAVAASTPGAPAGAPQTAPDISGQPVAGSVASAEGAATIDAAPPAPAPK